MTSRLYETQAQKVARLYDVLAFVNSEVTRLTTLKFASTTDPSVRVKATDDLEVMTRKQDWLTREYNAAVAGTTFVG